MIPYVSAIEQISRANSLDEIQSIVRQFSAAAEAPGGILYSGWVGDLRSRDIALELAARTGLPIIDNTERGRFLSDKEVESAITSKAGELFSQ
jgi:hypothetical protein